MRDGEIVHIFEIINIASFVFINLAFFGALAFPFLALIHTRDMDEIKYRAFVLSLLWLILIAILSGVGAYITA